MKIGFFGAAQNVTGSSYLVEVNGSRILVDCGLYQERKLKARNWDPFPVPANTIDAVVLTHAHLDHCGRLPKLAKEGFSGPIHCTEATADIATIVMLDSGKIQQEDAAYKKRRHEKEGRKGPFPEEPLYTVADAEAACSHLKATVYETPVQVADGLEVSFFDAGHILGSSMVRLTMTENGETRTIVFSGDVGRWDVPILRDPTCFDSADYVVVESTYGNRTHKDNSHIPDTLANVINETCKAGGNVVIPSFAVERTQELLYHLSGLLTAGRIRPLPVFLDSPMAMRVTEVFKRHPELFDEETIALLKSGKHPCDFPGLQMSRTVDESKAINSIRGSAIVIAGSGMCTGGRIKYHLVNNISRPESTVLFIGYQAMGTLGRIILEGAEEVRILGEPRAIKARIDKVNGFSAHADRNELFKWVSSLKQPPRHVFVTHGEPKAAAAFSEMVAEKTGWETSVPSYGDEIPLS